MKLVRKWRLHTLSVALLLAVLLVTLAPAGGAFAGNSGCRTDPVVTLTNGTQIQMEATIDTSLSNVESVVYTVHAPVGSRVLNILYTDSALGVNERVVFYADNLPGRYTTETVVRVRGPRTNVSATSRVVTLLGLDMGTASGRDSQRLRVELRP